MNAVVTPESVARASAQFWEPMLGMELDEVGSVPPEAVVEAEHVIGSCELDGVWRGHIEVRLSSGLARAATAAMLMQPVEEVTAADMLDAAKEIANMIAGTIKSVLPRPCTMSVPQSSLITAAMVCDAGDEELRAAGGARSNALAVPFVHASGLLVVCVRGTDATYASASDAATVPGSVPGSVPRLWSSTVPTLA